MNNKRLFIVLVLLCSLAYNIFFPSSSAFALDDSDVMIKYDVIADKDNAYTLLNEAGESLYYPDDELWKKIVDGKEWDNNYVKKVLDKNSKVFILYEKALLIDKIQAPPMTGGLASLLPNVFPWRQLALTLSVKSEYEFRSNQEDKAFGTALSIVRFGQKITLDKGGLVNLMIGLVIQDIGLEKICEFTNKSKLDSIQAKKYIDRLSNYQNTRQGIINAYKVDYLMYVYELEQMRHATYGDFVAFIKSMSLDGRVSGAKIEIKNVPDKADMPMDNYFNIDKTKEFAANYMRESIKVSLAKYYSQADRSKLKVMLSYLNEDCKTYKPENYFGRVFNIIMLSNIDASIKEALYISSKIDMTKALIALNVYKQDKCYLPDGLSELVPVYIDKVPTDYFTGYPISIAGIDEVLYFDNEYMSSQQKAEGKVEIKF